MVEDKNLDLTRIKPYGDTMNDGKVQISFTLPVEDSEKAIEASKKLAMKMGLENPSVVYHTSLDRDFTFFIMYGSLKYSIDFTKIQVESVDDVVMSKEEINVFIKENFNRKVIVLGASTGSDAHTVGIDAIMNRKGFAGHYGLEIRAPATIVTVEQIPSIHISFLSPCIFLINKAIATIITSP